MNRQSKKVEICLIQHTTLENNNLLLNKREGSTGEYWPEVVAVQSKRSKVCTKMTEGQHSPVRLELARLVSSLFYGNRPMLVLNLPAFENKKYTADDHFHGNSLYCEILTMKEHIRTLGFTLPYNNWVYLLRTEITALWHENKHGDPLFLLHF